VSKPSATSPLLLLFCLPRCGPFLLPAAGLAFASLSTVVVIPSPPSHSNCSCARSSGEARPSPLLLFELVACAKKLARSQPKPSQDARKRTCANRGEEEEKADERRRGREARRAKGGADRATQGGGRSKAAPLCTWTAPPRPRHSDGRNLACWRAARAASTICAPPRCALAHGRLTVCKCDGVVCACSDPQCSGRASVHTNAPAAGKRAQRGAFLQDTAPAPHEAQTERSSEQEG
jgi:hypothetical protein